MVLAAYSASEMIAGRSLGKQLCGRAIGRRDRSRAGRQRLFFRWLMKYALLVFHLLLVGVEWILFGTIGFSLADDHRLAWHAVRASIALLTLMWSANCPIGAILLVLPVRSPVHDLVSGTGVFLRHELREPIGGFEAVVDKASR